MSAMDKKGFTLVELAIVLVIVGLIIAMGIKGKSLIRAAQLQADLVKMAKFETAYNIYYSKYDKFPPLRPNPFNPSTLILDESELIRLSLLVPNDSFVPSSGKGHFFQFTRSSLLPTGKYTGNANGTLIVAGVASSSASTAMSEFYTCSLEKVLDDKNRMTGYGRFFSGNSATSDSWTTNTNPDGPYNDCYGLTGTVRDYGYLIYSTN